MTLHTTSGHGDQVHALVRELSAHDHWSSAQLREHQQARLRELLRHAVTTSPYYRQVLGTDVTYSDVPLTQLPTLSKATLMERYDEIVTDPRLKLADLEAHIAGPKASMPFLGEYRVLSTSGSTGLQGIFVYSDSDFMPWIAACIRMMSVLGVTPAMRLIGFGAPGAPHLSQHMQAGVMADRLVERPSLSCATPLPEMVQKLNAYQPEALLTYASIASLLAEEQLQGRLRIAPRIVGHTGEVLAEDMRHRIREAWGVESEGVYAATEAPAIASGSPEHVGMHLWEDHLIVEAVDERGQPVPPGVPSHKILVTNLVNRTQPLIRYELSDSIIVDDSPNPTGRPFRRIVRVEGRSDDILRLPAPGGRTVAVHPLRLRAPFTAFPDVQIYQIVHDGAGLHVRLVLRPSAPPDTPARVRAALARELQQVGTSLLRIDVTPVPTIDRESGHAAKFKLVKSSVSCG
jgi:phenylacetate-CoA ligase